MHSARPLSRAETRGTKTFYLPFVRTSTQPPEVTVMAGRRRDGKYAIGVAICSRGDQFNRREGRRRAFHRLQNQLLVFSAEDLRRLQGHLYSRFVSINARHPGTISPATFDSLSALQRAIPQRLAAAVPFEVPKQARRRLGFFDRMHLIVLAFFPGFGGTKGHRRPGEKNEPSTLTSATAPPARGYGVASPAVKAPADDTTGLSHIQLRQLRVPREAPVTLPPPPDEGDGF